MKHAMDLRVAMIVAIIRRNVKLLCSSDSARKSCSDTIAVKTILEVCVVMIFAADMLVLAWDSQLRKMVAHFNMQDLHASTSSESTHLHIYTNFPHYLASVLYHLLIIYPVRKKTQKNPLPLQLANVPRHAATTAFSEHTAVDGIRFVQFITLATRNPSRLGSRCSIRLEGAGSFSTSVGCKKWAQTEMGLLKDLKICTLW